MQSHGPNFSWTALRRCPLTVVYRQDVIGKFNDGWHSTQVSSFLQLWLLVSIAYLQVKLSIYFLKARKVTSLCPVGDDPPRLTKVMFSWSSRCLARTGLQIYQHTSGEWFKHFIQDNVFICLMFPISMADCKMKKHARQRSKNGHTNCKVTLQVILTTYIQIQMIIFFDPPLLKIKSSNITQEALWPFCSRFCQAESRNVIICEQITHFASDRD